ncbi:MAG TPA: hypothetical protein VF120_02920, partial [Ktedonobacterales bacterium]
MERPRRRADTSRPSLVPSTVTRAGGEPVRPGRLLLGFGLAYGVVGGLLGALDVVGVALAIALNQQQIISYTTQYTAYQQCLRENATPDICHAPTNGVLTVSAVWLLFVGTGLLAFILA